MTEVTVVEASPPELEALEAVTPEAAVQIAQIEGDTQIAIAETHAAVDIARIEAMALDETEKTWLRQTMTEQANRLDALQNQMNNLQSSIQPPLETPSSLEEVIAETAAETALEVVEAMTSGTPADTPALQPETPPANGEPEEAPAEIVTPGGEEAEGVPELVVAVKRKRVIV